MSACEQSRFEVGIVGQALPAMEKLRVTDTLRNNPRDFFGYRHRSAPSRKGKRFLR
jgi:hypothetical protein